jgi:hypothetical protein
MDKKEIQDGYKSGFVTKDDYEKTMCASGTSLDEMKSDERDRYAAHLIKPN